MDTVLEAFKFLLEDRKRHGDNHASAQAGRHLENIKLVEAELDVPESEQEAEPETEVAPTGEGAVTPAEEPKVEGE